MPQIEGIPEGLISEANNLGIGEGLFASKTNHTLNFRTLNSPTNVILFSLSGNELGLDIDQSVLSLANFSGNLDDIDDGTTYVRSTNDFTDTEKSKLLGIADGAEVNVNADWNSSTGDSEILNKPTLGTMSSIDDAPSDGNQYSRLNGAWSVVSFTSDVTSVFGRSGDVIATSGDYDSSMITNTSDITGATIDDALNNINTDKVELAANLGTGINLYSGKTGQTLNFHTLNSPSNTILFIGGGDEVGLEVNQSALSLANFSGNLDNIDDGTTYVKSENNYTDVDKTKMDYITVTQSVDLDQMEIDIAALANGMVYKGNWDASTGVFPGSNAAQTGWFYYVSGAGTVDGVTFDVGDNIVATTDNASSTTYAANWSKHDQTDAVQDVVGLIGSISKSSLLTALNVEDGAEVNNISDVNAATLTDGSNADALHIHSFSSDVTSVFGRSGDVIAQAGDYTAAQITNAFDKTVDDSDDITEGGTNLFFTTTERNKLTGIADGAEVNVNADWNSSTGDSEILNKPTLGTMSSIDDAPSDGSQYARLNGAWSVISDAGGDMLASVYDPTSIAADAFDMDNMVEGTSNKILTSAERTILGNTSGTNTGDQTSIVGITGTMTQFNTALTDGVFVYQTDLTNLFNVTTNDSDDITEGGTNLFNQTHTGDVTGATALTIANDAVTYAKMQNAVSNNVILGNNTGAGGAISELSANDVRTLINVEDGAEVNTVQSVAGLTGIITDSGLRSAINVEDGADVTDAANVDAAGATMNTDASLSGNSYFLDEDAMTSNSNTKVASQQSIKAYVDNNTQFEDVSGTITNKSSKNLNVDSAQAWVSSFTLTDGTTISTDCNNGNIFSVTLGENGTLANPTNLKNGATYLWIIKQDGTGSRTLAFGSAFKFEGGTAPTLSTDANAVDIITGVSDGTNVYCVASLAFA